MEGKVFSNVVVIHPGATTIRFGFAGDPSPHVVPHCVALRTSAPRKQRKLAGANDATFDSASQHIRDWCFFRRARKALVMGLESISEPYSVVSFQRIAC